MARYECSVCGFVYDESQEDSRWEELPDDWTCPVCGATKSQFQRIDGESADAGADARTQPTLGPALNRAALAHRVFGYVFLAIYVVLLVQMVPRLWTYQIELPARTVLHVALAVAVGVALILKILIVRFFRRLDPALAPALGTSILVGSFVLIGISVPSAFREALATSRLFTGENQQRLKVQLAQLGLSSVQCRRLASPDTMRAGRRVLRQHCIHCHDLRTVLAKPRTPATWRQTVRRMAERTAVVSPLDEDTQWQVTAYLIALSPQLQRSIRQLRDERQRQSESRKAAAAMPAVLADSASHDAAAAKELFETKCSQCHETTLVHQAALGSRDDARQLVARMVDEGLEATDQELSRIVQHLTDVYVRPVE